MRIAALPKMNDSARLRLSPGQRAAKTVDRNTQPLKRKQLDSESLIIDLHTQKDLEIFNAEEKGTSLFDFCNLTTTNGGASLLKQRMEKPWSNSQRIKATQASLAFVVEHREAFSKLPAYITQRVENYQRDVLLMVTQSNKIEFSISAFAIWANHDRHYRNIVRGVQIACGVTMSLRRYVNQPELADARGELGPILAEMKELLARPNMELIPDKEIEGGWFWRILRLDQIFRLHEKETTLRLLQLVYETDALVSMADATINNGFILPEVVDGHTCVQGIGLVHPYIENAVPNCVELDQSKRVLFLTGPNMAGKTTYLRASAIALYFAHLGMGVPAKSFRFAPAERLFSTISLSDDLHTGVSYFHAEALRVKAVAQAIFEGHRVIALMDEPFKGTNVKDAFDASLEILKHLVGKKDCLFMFSSHLIELSEPLQDTPQISSCHFEAQETGGRLNFEYCLRPGVSKQRLGVRVLHEEGVFELLKGR